MKTREKKQARELRKTKGWSLKQISDILDVSKSTVSLWVRDIQLTDEQVANLPTVVINQNHVSKSNAKKWIKKRIEWQHKGRREATYNPEHLVGCILYWAEGNKKRDIVGFSNTDPYMTRIFINFLKNCYNINNEEIKISFNVHLDCGLTLKDVEKYWLNLLGLERESLRKSRVNYLRKQGRKNEGKYGRKNKLPYGVCEAYVCSVELSQRIFGSIKQYAGIDDENLWI